MNTATCTFRLLSRGSKAILQQRSIITARPFSILKNSRLANPVKITFNGIKPSKLNQLSQIRTVQTLDFGGSKEKVHERSDWPKEKFQKLFENDTIAIIGYGPQGRGQSLNAKDNGLNVIVGLREGGRSWKLALEDGWVPGKNLFSINDALSKGTIIGNLLSDAAQKELWPQFVPHLTKGKTIYFSHGFSIVYKDQTNVVPPKDIDVIMIAPKGSGKTVRSQFLDGRGINSSFAVYQDTSGKARDRCVALGIAIGSGYLYETDFKKEVFSDLYGERGVLMGAIQGLFLAQYEVLREHGHTPSEAFNETVEEATQSLYPLIGENGMDW
ncbi:6513_t:CDS:2 [Dentiscutata erythropus]|uniref:Acetohydroxy-acid reductoisomerase n=1 Tax=Dentiscutata erythropus TaxID=1348616 RepID=A0A9N9JUM0_9GLOM|nr:6513_t:CDS:2 [Dentiscutata erythropus]